MCCRRRRKTRANFVAVFGQSEDDPTKGQLLALSRKDFRNLSEERCRINVKSGLVGVDARKMDALPERRVPQQFFHVPSTCQGLEKCTGRWPDTIRDTVGAAQSNDVALAELGDESGSDERLAGNYKQVTHMHCSGQ